MAVDALVLHAHGRSPPGALRPPGGARRGALAALGRTADRAPPREGMLAPGPRRAQTPLWRQERRRQGPAMTPKATLPVAPSLAANSPPADDGATAGSGTGGTPPFAGRGPEGAADSNTPLTEDASRPPPRPIPHRRDRHHVRSSQSIQTDDLPAPAAHGRRARISSASRTAAALRRPAAHDALTSGRRDAICTLPPIRP
ncbi:hypothetical protein ZWY2020_008351 [Hordeum vulgare]|nr:hypothetical protein ZWY2020_008351 [Hordeum vulgare]